MHSVVHSVMQGGIYDIIPVLWKDSVWVLCAPISKGVSHTGSDVSIHAQG